MMSQTLQLSPWNTRSGWYHGGRSPDRQVLRAGASPTSLSVPSSPVSSNDSAVSVVDHSASAPSPDTVTVIDCVALSPPGSRAVTVTAAVPAATGVVTVLPDAPALTMPVRLEVAV